MSLSRTIVSTKCKRSTMSRSVVGVAIPNNAASERDEGSLRTQESLISLR